MHGSTLYHIIQPTVIIYVALTVGIYFMADKLMFYPPNPTYTDDDAPFIYLDTVKTRIAALYAPVKDAPYVVLLSHGNAEDIGHMSAYIDVFNQIGLSVFAYDYSGYGLSTGAPGEKQAYDDINTAYRYLINNLKINPDKIIAFGRSIGGGPTVELARTVSLAGIILENPFVTAYRTVTQVPIFLGDKFKNIDKINELSRPILFIGSERDKVIPRWHHHKLHEHYKGEKYALWLSEASHNNLLDVDLSAYKEALTQFIKQLEVDSMR